MESAKPDSPPQVRLFEWFAEWFGRVRNGRCSGPPGEVLRQAGAPGNLYPWIETLCDTEHPLKETPQGWVPDLEKRHRACRRGAGQYYTPESLVKRLLVETGLSGACGAALDPACGDGAFLVPLAELRLGRNGAGSLNELTGIDLDAEALLTCLARLIAVAPERGWPRLEQRDFLLDPPEGRFRLVLGNPPYRVNLPKTVCEKLAERYATTEGEKDLYTFFIEGGLNLLEPDGALLLLTSHGWLVNHQCAKIRTLAFAGHDVRRLFLLPTRFFPDAPGVIPVVTEIHRVLNEHASVRVYDAYDETEGWRIRRTAPAERFLEPTGLRKALADPVVEELFERMEAGNARLGEIAKIGVGIQESTRRGDRVSRFVSGSPTGATAVRVIRGREVEPFRIRWEGLFLDYGPHLTYAGDPEIFRGEKLVYQNLRHETLPVRLVAALDRDGFFPKNSLSYICRPKSPFSLEYIAGLLNSRLVNAWFAGRFFSFHVTVTQVRSIPIPEADERRRGAVEQIVRRLANLSPGDGIRESDAMQLSLAVAACYFPDKDPLQIVRQIA
ncbi:MAG TPA: TaqI-like C-terminal specificity domain-containing protein [Candidatus Ozemobacteraceae bacterium]|nr:TaqI-like C-terminal specificity domain-containing protein [Candidatus Ozemobacteraceae bacterium]